MLVKQLPKELAMLAIGLACVSLSGEAASQGKPAAKGEAARASAPKDAGGEAPYADDDNDAPVAGEASPEEKKLQARGHFKRAVESYRQGQYRAALIAFQRANELAPSYKVLFNLGQTSLMLRDYVAAKKSFAAYLTQGGDDIAPERRAEAEAELAKLAGYIGQLRLEVDVEGAEILVDDVVIGKTPSSKPLLLSFGRRKIRVQKAGYAPEERYLDVAGGDDLKLELSLRSLKAPVPGAFAPGAAGPVARRAEPPSEIPFWAAVSVTGALAITTAVVGGLALKASGDYQDQLNTFPNTEENITNAGDDVDQLSGITDVLLGITAVGAVATTVLGVATFGGGDDGADSASARLGLGLGTLTLTGRF